LGDVEKVDGLAGGAGVTKKERFFHNMLINKENKFLCKK